MIKSATIEGFKKLTATRGDGARVFGDELVVVCLPCEILDPSAHRVETDRQRGIRNDAMIRVRRAALETQSIEPAVGDRLDYRKVRMDTTNTAPPITTEITDLREKGAGTVLELTLAVRDDDAIDGQGGAL